VRLDRVKDRRAALRTEGGASFLALVVGVADVLLQMPLDLEALDRERRLVAECAPGAPLAGKAVTGRDADRLAFDRDMKLAAAAGCLAGHDTILALTLTPGAPGNGGTVDASWPRPRHPRRDGHAR
jgi:hypothetical protein